MTNINRTSEQIASPLPTNAEVAAFSDAIPWYLIEQQKRRFVARLKELREQAEGDEILLEDLAAAAEVPLTLKYSGTEPGNVLLAHVNGRQYIMASFASKRYRGEKTLLKSVVPYNFNPSVNHTNLHETDNPSIDMRQMGAELELGLYHADGNAPSEDEMNAFISYYDRHARVLGIAPTVDREACQYQIEVHISPGIGYHRTRTVLDAIMSSLVAASCNTGLNTAIMSAYPILSDFRMTPDPKVQTALIAMTEANQGFPAYLQRQDAMRKRYHMPDDANVIEIFRLQGCHVHLDVAGRSEALGLFAFYTMLRSATAIANAAMLKGGPFVNGTCDPELLCTREYLRSMTVTGRYLELPLAPHLLPDDMQRYGDLLHNDGANAPARALLCEGGLGRDISAMHNPYGRVRPDLGMSRRICTIESTGMPVNISASRQAAALADFEFTHALVENYYRQHGTDLRPMYDDPALLAIIGPLSTQKFTKLQDHSDRVGTDMLLETPTGTKMSLEDFYEMKRVYMHRHLIGVTSVKPPEIDDVYMSLRRMINPPSGLVATTVEHFITDPARRSTGNWGKILRDAFIEEGGTPGEHNPEAVLRVANRVHDALCERYS
jgi:hypothetical protein